MPQYKEHIVASVVAYSVILLIFSLYKASPLYLLEWLCWAILGGLFPDIDIKSKGQKLLYRLLALVIIYLAIYERFQLLSVICLVACFPLMVNHRGIFHELWFLLVLVVSGAAITISRYPCSTCPIILRSLFFFAGVTSHVWLDIGLRKMLKLK
ncbi:MAG TPA: metal-dependent hydrolase [Candidatus Babeliaceae bacterium]|nr:metal-dependent hydrolase [Candidatus Babeliaceae bacterium]